MVRLGFFLYIALLIHFYCVLFFYSFVFGIKMIFGLLSSQVVNRNSIRSNFARNHELDKQSNRRIFVNVLDQIKWRKMNKIANKLYMLLSCLDLEINSSCVVEVVFVTSCFHFVTFGIVACPFFFAIIWPVSSMFELEYFVCKNNVTFGVLLVTLSTWITSNQHRTTRHNINNNTKRKESQCNPIPNQNGKWKKKISTSRAIHRFHLIFIIHSGNQCLSKRLANEKQGKKNKFERSNQTHESSIWMMWCANRKNQGNNPTKSRENGKKNPITAEQQQ